MYVLVADAPTSSADRRNVFLAAWRKLREARTQDYNLEPYKRKKNKSIATLRRRIFNPIVSSLNIPFLKRRKSGEKKTISYMDQFVEVNARHRRRTVVGNGVRICTCCPSSRSGHRIFATDDFIYVLGGYDPLVSAKFTFTDAWRFNLVTERWEQLFTTSTFLPKCLASFSLVPTSVPGEVLLFGGTGVPFGSAASDKLLRVNFHHDGTYKVSSVAADGDALPRLYGQAMAYRQTFNAASHCFHDAIYLVGGTSGVIYNMNVWRVESSDSPSDKWKCTFYECNGSEEHQRGRYRLETVVTDRHLITFGGGSPGYCAGFEELSAFDLQTNNYVVLPTAADPTYGYPPSRKCHAIVEFEGGVYMIGGLNETIDVFPDDEIFNKHILSDIWRYDLATSCWQKLRAELPIPVFFHAAAVTKDGCIYVFGGCTTKDSSERTNRLQRLWLHPPPLRYLAVRALIGTTITTPHNKYEWDNAEAIDQSQACLASISRMFWPYYTGDKGEYLLR